jgi:exodeoxyribonuclease VII large subunit
MLSAMSQLPMFEPAVWGVSDITQHIRSLFEGDPVLQDVWVSGEVSNTSRPASGHLYFTIKDRTAALRCVMWRSQVIRQTYQLRDGDAIEVHGSVSVYDAGGNYQLYADVIRPAGEGVLYQEFLRLKAQLEGEGLFDPQRKRPLPLWPQRIGIVTSPSGAALRDMLNTLRRRYPLVEVILAPSAVQGEDAPAALVAALQALQQLQPPPDVILIGRGGGSIEDLWAFNDERLARAVATARIPVVSGVGHETDFTIVDFVADVRAATPTAAAELAVPDISEIALDIQEYHRLLDRSMLQLFEQLDQRLEHQRALLERRSPLFFVRIQRQRVDDLQRRLMIQSRHKLALKRKGVENLSQKLAALDPASILKRGYAVVRTREGKVVSDTSQLETGDPLKIQVARGRFGAQVTEISPPDDQGSPAP